MGVRTCGICQASQLDSVSKGYESEESILLYVIHTINMLGEWAFYASAVHTNAKCDKAKIVCVSVNVVRCGKRVFIE